MTTIPDPLCLALAFFAFFALLALLALTAVIRAGVPTTAITQTTMRDGRIDNSKHTHTQVHVPLNVTVPR